MLTENQVFDAAHTHVMKWEGGFFDHPADPGGVTKYGVSLMFLKSAGLLEGDIDGDGDIDRQDVLAITKENAKKLFKRHFWDKPKACLLPPLIAVPFYDLAVNAGVGRSIKIMQEALGVSVDGVVGKNTRFAIDMCHPFAAAMCMLDCRTAWYRRLARLKPSSAVFLKGWLNRTSDCRLYLIKLSEQWEQHYDEHL